MTMITLISLILITAVTTTVKEVAGQLDFDLKLFINTQNLGVIEPYVAAGLRRLSRRRQLEQGGGGLSEQDKANYIRFHLFRSDADDDLYQGEPSPQEIVLGDLDSLRGSNFRSSQPVKILIHGFGHTFFCSPIHQIKDAYLSYGSKVNIIAVDWLTHPLTGREPPVQALLNYELAVRDSIIVGRRVGDFVQFLVQSGATTTSQIHILGYSIGAHIAGYAAEHIGRHHGLAKVGRITGLEPAGPLFTTGLIGRHLYWGDADFVDFIHTDWGQSGTVKSMGHANFFANGGTQPQPGCRHLPQRETNSILPNMFSAACSHSASVNYYAQSIRPNANIPAQICTAGPMSTGLGGGHGGGLSYGPGPTVIFGENCIPGSRGNFCFNLGPVNFPRRAGCDTL